MIEKLDSLKCQVKALKNTNVTNIISLKHNATVAVAMAVDLIEELTEKVCILEKKLNEKGVNGG